MKTFCNISVKLHRGFVCHYFLGLSLQRFVVEKSYNIASFNFSWYCEIFNSCQAVKYHKSLPAHFLNFAKDENVITTIRDIGYVLNYSMDYTLKSFIS